MLSTLIELQRLKRLDRTGWTLRGLPNGTESVAAHSFGVAVATMLLADELLARGVSVDVEKVLRMALLHDWAEVRVGDMPRIATAYFGAEARKQAETRAFADVVSELKRDLYAALYTTTNSAKASSRASLRPPTCSTCWFNYSRSNAPGRVDSTNSGKWRKTRTSNSARSPATLFAKS